MNARRTLLCLALGLLASLGLVVHAGPAAAAFPPCKLPGSVPAPPMTPSLTCTPWEGLTGSDLRHRWGYAGMGPVRHAWVDVYNPPVNSVQAGSPYDEFVESIEIRRTDGATIVVTTCTARKWLASDHHLSCRFDEPADTDGMFDYTIRYLDQSKKPASYTEPDVRTP